MKCEQFFPEFNDLFIFQMKNLSLLLTIHRDSDYELICSLVQKFTVWETEMPFTDSPVLSVTRDELENSSLSYSIQMYLFSLLSHSIMLPTALTRELLNWLQTANPEQLEGALMWVYCNYTYTSVPLSDISSLIQEVYETDRTVTRELNPTFHSI